MIFLRCSTSLFSFRKSIQYSTLNNCCWKHIQLSLDLPFDKPYKFTRKRSQLKHFEFIDKTQFLIRKPQRLPLIFIRNQFTLSLMLKAENVSDEIEIIDKISKEELANYLEGKILTSKKYKLLFDPVNLENLDDAWKYYQQHEKNEILIAISLKFQIQLLYYSIKLSKFEAARIIISQLHKRRNEMWLKNYLHVMECLSTLNLNEAIRRFKIHLIKKDDFPRFKVLSSLMLALLKNEDILGMEELMFSAEQYFENSLPPEIYNTMMAGYVKNKGYRRACTLLEKMEQKNISPTRVTYNILLNLCAKIGKKVEALELFDDMIKSNIEPDARTYSAIFEAFGRVKNVSQCKYYFAQMISKGIKPNAYTYGILIAACARSGKYAEASKWFHHMVNISNIQPTLITYTSLLVAWTIQACYDKRIVDRILEDIKKSGIKLDVIAYTALMHAKAKTYNFAETIRVYQEMLKSGIKPNVYTYTVLITASAKLGDLKTSLRLFEDMKKADIQPNEYTYCSIMDAYAKNRMLSKAFEFHNEMISKGIKPDTTCINCLMDACNRERQVDRVFELYNKLVTDPNLEPDECSITIFIDSCSFNNRPNDGKIFFENLVINHKEISERNFYAYINLLEQSRNCLHNYENVS
ncbi:8496_t:CDS:2 [Diversispora eburnea]|uniref:8496_t:CDS:1 n=2 Tax=Diversisporales TaxID=214509 RepID=A0A9N8WEK3_9GLOM|nr:8496_t:CDS:2 [Diversispora eburnea]